MASPASASAGSVAQTMNGARARVFINGVLIGLATDCSWSSAYGMEPVFTLGKYEAQEIVPTSAEPIEVTLNGMRVVQSGPHKGFDGNVDTSIMVPVLAELLNNKDMTILIEDRQIPAGQTKAPVIMTVYQCRSKGHSSQVSAKGLMTLSMTFIGIRSTDEHATDAQIKDQTATPSSIT